MPRAEGLLRGQVGVHAWLRPSPRLLAIKASLAIALSHCCRLEDALRKQAAEVERSTRDWAAHEAELSAAHSRTHGTSAAAQAEMAMVQEALDAANRRARTLEADNAELRRQKAAAAADLRMLEELLADGDTERRCVDGCSGEGALTGPAGDCMARL